MSLANDTEPSLSKKKSSRRQLPPELQTLEYYHFVLPGVLANLRDKIREAVHGDRQALHDQFWKPKFPNSQYNSVDGWELVSQYADVIEKQIASIVRTHSAFYWIHLYRRLGVVLPSELYPGKA